MSEIPEDIMNAARKAAIKIAAVLPIDNSDDVNVIAKAIWNERLRCARIAEEWNGPEKLLPLCSNEYNEIAAVGMHEASERISQAILNQTEE